MGRKGKTNWKYLAIALILAAVIGTSAYFGYKHYISTQSTVVVTTWDLSIEDKFADQDLPLSGFSYDLYGLPIGDSPTDTLAWELIESGSTLEGISAGDLDTTEYSQFYVRYNGTAAQTVFDDTLGTRTYPSRQASLTPGVANTLGAYAQPAATILEVKYQANLTCIANLTATPLIAKTNATFIIAVAAAFMDCGYMNYWSYSANDYVYPQLVLTYNETVTTSTALQIPGTSMVRVSATQMAYRIESLTGVQSFYGNWPSGATAGSIGVTAGAVAFDGSDLATNP